ncbi:neuroligin-like protein glit-1, partial [Pollicipes pollicipes]|uniref:neuroligin-like protein glit-1 n=1 Tax=Pollicipes pollicipes TaxID=41117 RepID=UPI001884FD0F
LPLLLLCAAAAAAAPGGTVNRFGQWRVATTAPPAAPADPATFRNGGRRQCPPPAGGDNANVGYDKFDPNRCVDADVGVLAGWRPDLQGARRPGEGLTNPLVELRTQLGPLTGFRVKLFDEPGLRPEEWPARLQPGVHKERRTVTAFLGVPYALPPVQEARFKPPRARPGWQRWLALDYGPACPQPARFVGAGRGVREVDEDCLYLNVFTPQVSSNVKELYAVMVHIHGGEFSHGSSNRFPGHMLAAWGQVVVVTFNYRLGALGFLSTGDEHSPGNYGLLDQAMALRWVYDNVHYFNGDRRRITVFGDDAGAASAGLLAVSPRTAHIVHQVIAQSGSPLADWAAISDLEWARNTSRVFGERIGCLADTSAKLVNCLSRGRSALEIGDVEFTPDVGVFPWAPVVQANISLPPDGWYEGWTERDWRVLPDLPAALYRARAFSGDLRLLTGVNRDEAAPFVYGNASLAPDYVITQRWLDTKVREWAEQHNYTLNLNGVTTAMRHLYTYWPDPKNQTWIRQMYINFVSDALYTAPVDAMVKMALELDVPTYQYVLNTTVEALEAPLWRQVPHGLQYYIADWRTLLGPPSFCQETFDWTGTPGRRATET